MASKMDKNRFENESKLLKRDKNSIRIDWREIL